MLSGHWTQDMNCIGGLWAPHETDSVPSACIEQRLPSLPLSKGASELNHVSAELESMLFFITTIPVVDNPIPMMMAGLCASWSI